MITGLQILKDMTKSTTEVVEIRPKSKKTDITTLTRADFCSSELRAKYFRAYNRDLDRLHLPVMTKEVYEPIAQEEFNNPRMDKANLKFETASSYYIRKAQLFVLACDLGVNPKTLDSSNYIWNEDYYIHSNFLINIDIAEELYREGGDDWRDASANQIYIKQEPRNSSVDYALWNQLYKLCYGAILSRKVMLLHKVPQCLSFLVSVAEYTNGFAENCTGTQTATLKSYVQFFTELLNNEEALKFINSTNDIELFAKHEATRKDYVETYRNVLRRMSSCAGNELEYFRRELTANLEDPCLELILAEELDPEDFLSGGYLENESDGEELIAEE